MGKVFKNGHSLAVTVPKIFAHQLNIKSGSEIEWKKTNSGLLFSTALKVKNKGIDQKFAKIVEEFIDEHEDVLKELAKR